MFDNAVASMFRLDGKVALITGSGRGMGLAIAKTLALAGCAVAVQDIDHDVAAGEVDGINSSGAVAIALGGDITDPATPAALVEQTTRRLGNIDILVNNAAIQSVGEWTSVSVEQMHQQLQANLVAPLLLSQLTAPGMIARRWGRIVNIGSVQQRSGNAGMLAYSLSKAALEKMTTALARRLAGDGVTVNLIAPGWMNTWRNREQFPDEAEVQRLGSHVPAGRIGRADDVAGLALLLCSDAASYITAQSIYVDGGLTAR